MTTSSTTTPVAPDEIWYDFVDGLSPEIEPSPVSPHMQFTSAAASSTDGPTTALYAGYNLGWPYIELYGGQMPAPINIVATNLMTGEVYMSPAYYSDTSLQMPVELFLSDAELGMGQPANNFTFTNAWFNIDLPKLLDMPPDEGLYGVTLWLDDLITTVQSVQVPSNKNRPNSPPADDEVTASGLVTIRKSADSPSPTDGEIRMDGPLPGAGNRIYATLPNNVFSSPPMPIDGATPVLTLMGFCQRSRAFFWYRDTSFYATAKKDKIYSFDFDPFKLVTPPGGPESIFIVSQLGTLRSEALWVPADQSSSS